MQGDTKNLLFSNYAKFIFRNNQVIATNQLRGEWIRFSKECYDYLTQAIDLGLTKDSFIECFEEKSDQIYIQKLVDNLETIKVLTNDDDINIENEPHLESVELILTNRCNLSCRHCSANAMNVTGTDFLDTDDIIKIIDKIVACNAKNIILTGGEPLLRKDFMDIVRYINLKDKEIKITLMTNATLLTAELATEITKYISAVDISLDGYDDESCSDLRGNNVFRKVLNSIELLQNKGMEKISLSMVSLGNDQKGKTKFEELCRQLKVAPVIRRLSFMGRAKENERYLRNRRKENRDSYTKIPTDENFRKALRACSCNAGIESLSIDERGLIYPCINFKDDMDEIGNILNIESLSEFINKCKNGMDENGMKFFKYLPYYGDICSDCSVRYFCWTCPYAAIDMEKNKRLPVNCLGHKEYLHQIVWGED